MRNSRVRISLVFVCLLIFSGAIAGCAQESDGSQVTPEQHNQLLDEKGQLQIQFDQLHKENGTLGAEKSWVQGRADQLQKEKTALVEENAQLRKNLEILGGPQAIQLQKRCDEHFEGIDRVSWAEKKLANSWNRGVFEGELRAIASCAPQVFPPAWAEFIAQWRNLKKELAAKQNQVDHLTQDRDNYRISQERLLILAKEREAEIEGLLAEYAKAGQTKVVP